MDVTASLEIIKPGTPVRVLSVAGEEAMRRRLMELGFTPRAIAVPVTRAVSGDPTAYWICGTVIALRADDAAGITVELL